MIIKRFKLFFIVLIALATLGQVSADLYLPSLPHLIHDLSTNSAFGQLSVALYMAGYMVAQLIYGPLSDGVGRRYPLLVGMIIFITATVACATASNIYIFILARLLQGLGSGAAVTLSRCILRDVFSREQLAKYMSFMAIFVVGIMASAPLLGGYLQHYFGWRFSFYLLLVYGVAMFILIFCFIAETNAHKNTDNLYQAILLSNLKRLLTNKVFMSGAIIAAFSYSGFLAWLTAGPFIIQDSLGYSPIIFGWMAFVVSISYCFTSYVNGKIVGRYALNALIQLGLLGMFLSALAMLLLQLFGFFNIYVIVIPMSCFAMSTAFTFVNCFARAFEPFAEIAGIATAVYSFIQISGGFLSSSFMAYLHDATQLPLALWLLGGSLLCLTIQRILLVK